MKTHSIRSHSYMCLGLDSGKVVLRCMVWLGLCACVFSHTTPLHMLGAQQCMAMCMWVVEEWNGGHAKGGIRWPDQI